MSEYIKKEWSWMTKKIANQDIERFKKTKMPVESFHKVFDFVNTHLKKLLNNMKVVFLHGYRSTNKGEKYDEMRKHFDQVISPKINWDDKNVYESLRNIIKKENPDIIIGSSMGGYAAYNLGNEFNIKTLLFNPAFNSRPVEPMIEKHQHRDLHTIVLGNNDTVINNKETYDIFENKAIIKIEPISHRIPIGIFRKHIRQLVYGESIVEKFSNWKDTAFLYEMKDPKEWTDISLHDLTDEELANIWDMYTKTYGGQGMDFSADHMYELKTKYNATLLKDVDSDGFADAFMIYRATKWGNKIALLGTNDKKEAKKELITKLIELVNVTGWFIEASKKLEDILNDVNAPVIDNWQMIEDVVGKDKEPIQTGDGYYTRKLSKADKRITKRMYGIPFTQ